MTGWAAFWLVIAVESGLAAYGFLFWWMTHEP